MSHLDNFPWKSTFFQDDFNLDQCFSKLTQKTNLDTLKSYLRNYGNELHRQMAEILKTETEAIVNLAEYLTYLNTKIDALSVSLSQLQEELQILHTLIKNAESDYKKFLDNKRFNEIEKNCLLARLDFISITLYVDNIIRNVKISEPEDLMDLERVIYKYSFQRNYLLELGMTEMNTIVASTESKLLNMVHQEFLKSLRNKDVNLIMRCLHMYSNLDKQKEAEEFYRVKVVRPVLLPIYTEKCLDKFNQDVNQIYSETLMFLNSDMDVLNTLLKNSDLNNSFNFILNSFWVEVDRQCRKGLPHITAPGNPELFQKRFVSTWTFLKEIAKKCGNENLIKTHPSFQDHIKRFNLPVYFEIRFQQIASQFESDLAVTIEDSSVYIAENDFGFMLKITLNLYVALKKCFDDHVFIDQLADHFLKFSMFLLSRYIMWFENILNQGPKHTNWEKFIMNSLVDMKKIIELLAAKENPESSQNMYASFPKTMEPVMLKVLESNYRVITMFSTKLSTKLVSIKVTECCEQLHNVTAIPRLFRRTNRNPPKEASSYVVEAIKPILLFNENYKNTRKPILEPLLNDVILGITQQYSTLIQDVLRSVCKTEESLRRLKSRNTQCTDDASPSASSETMSDEKKIREQIKLDINYFITMLSQIATPNSREALDKLGRNLS